MRGGASRMHARVAAAVLADEGPALTDRDREDVIADVVSRIAGAPAHIRVGVGAMAMVLGPVAPAVRYARWDDARLLPVRRYAQLVRALTLFAAYERAAPLARS
jgi:hypothetical protein